MRTTLHDDHDLRPPFPQHALHREQQRPTLGGNTAGGCGSEDGRERAGGGESGSNTSPRGERNGTAERTAAKVYGGEGTEGAAERGGWTEQYGPGGGVVREG